MKEKHFGGHAALAAAVIALYMLVSVCATFCLTATEFDKAHLDMKYGSFETSIDLSND